MLCWNKALLQINAFFISGCITPHHHWLFSYNRTLPVFFPPCTYWSEAQSVKTLLQQKREEPIWLFHQTPYSLLPWEGLQSDFHMDIPENIDFRVKYLSLLQQIFSVAKKPPNHSICRLESWVSQICLCYWWTPPAQLSKQHLCPRVIPRSKYLCPRFHY